MSFVGREHELGRLGVALEQAAAGRLTRVVLTGPTGVGVSRLLAELEQRLGGELDLLIARATAYAPLGEQPYAPVAAALGRLLARLPEARLAEVAGPNARELAALLPGLAPALRDAGALPSDVRAGSDELGSRLLEALLGVLERIGRQGVVLLGLDDLQWADPGTLAFVDMLARISRPLRLCAVLAFHPDELDRHHPFGPLARQLLRNDAVERISLEPLGRAELAQMIESAVGERPSAGLLAAVAERSTGLPLLATELIAARDSVSALRLSDPFEELLDARVARLGDAAMRCVRVLAALRRPIEPECLLRLEQGGVRLSAAGLDEALDSGLAGREVDGVVIAHPRYAEAIEAALAPLERHALHRALVRYLETSPAERAWHLEAALDPAAAGPAHAAAGDAAVALDPGPTALKAYLRALELDAGRPVEPGRVRGEATSSPAAMEPTADPTLERARLTARAAEAAFLARSFRRASVLAGSAIDGLAASRIRGTAPEEAPASRARALELALLYERLGRYRRAAGDGEGSMAALRTAVELVPAGATAGRARVLASLGQALMVEGRYEESLGYAREAIEVAQALDDAGLAERGHATCTLGVDVAYLGDLETGLRVVREAADISRRAGRPADLMRAYANMTTLLDLDTRRELALTVMEEGIAEAARWGQEAIYGAFLRGNAADCLYSLGRWAESEAMCRRALEWNPSGLEWFVPLIGLALVRVESAADEAAGRVLGQLLMRLEHAPDVQWSANVQRATVSYALWRDDLADAERSATRDWERVLQGGDWRQIAMAAATTVEVAAAMASGARSGRDAPGVSAAAELADRVLAEAEERVAGSGAPPTLGARREAELYVTTARAHRDRLHDRATPAGWAAIADAWLQVPVPYNAARARWWEAEAALRSRAGARSRADRVHARRALAQAWRLAAQLGARPLQRAILDLADRARIQPPGFLPGEVAPDEGVPVAGSSGETTRAGVAAPSSGEAPGSDDGATAFASEPAGGLLQRLVPARQEAHTELFSLSPRELEVLRILAEGRTNREIAHRLYISEKTVAIHVGNVLAKLRVSGRVEAATLALRLGLVPAGPPGRTGRRRGA